MKMIESRIKSSHTYQEEIAKEIVAQLREKYFDLFCKPEQKLTDLMLPYTFDIAVYNNIKAPELKNHMNQVGISFYKKTGNEIAK